MQSSFGAGKRYAFRPQEAESGPLKVGISGILSLETVKEFTADVDGLFARTSAPALIFDLSGIEYLDSTGALALTLSRDKAARKSIQLLMTGMSAETGRMIGIVAPEATYNSNLAKAFSRTDTYRAFRMKW